MSTAWRREWRRYRRAAKSAWPAALVGLVLLAACGDQREQRQTGGVAAVTPDTTAQTPAAPDSTAPASEPGTSTSPGADSMAARAKDTTTQEPTPAAKPAPARKPAAPAAKPAPAQTPAPAERPESAQAATPTPAPTAQQLSDTTSGQTATANAPLRDPYHQAPRDTVSQDVYQGWKQFNLNCARCHGEDVLGTTIAPHLIVSLKPDGPINTKESFVQVVCAGRPAKGMPAWCALGLEMDKIENIYAYVKGRSDAKIGPGRPAVRQ